VIFNQSTGVGRPTSPARSPASAPSAGIAACNAGSLNYLKVKSDGSVGGAAAMLFDNPVEKVQDSLEVMAETGALPEFECFDTGIVRHRRDVRAHRVYRGHLDYNFVMGVESGMPADPELLPILTRLIAPGATWQVTAIGRANVWPLHRRTAELGGNLAHGPRGHVLPAGRQQGDQQRPADRRHRAPCARSRPRDRRARPRRVTSCTSIEAAARRPKGDTHGPDAAHRGRATAGGWSPTCCSGRCRSSRVAWQGPAVPGYTGPPRRKRTG